MVCRETSKKFYPLTICGSLEPLHSECIILLAWGTHHSSSFVARWALRSRIMSIILRCFRGLATSYTLVWFTSPPVLGGHLGCVPCALAWECATPLLLATTVVATGRRRRPPLPLPPPVGHCRRPPCGIGCMSRFIITMSEDSWCAHPDTNDPNQRPNGKDRPIPTGPV